MKMKARRCELPKLRALVTEFAGDLVREEGLDLDQRTIFLVERTRRRVGQAGSGSCHRAGILGIADTPNWAAAFMQPIMRRRSMIGAGIRVVPRREASSVCGAVRVGATGVHWGRGDAGLGHVRIGKRWRRSGWR